MNIDRPEPTPENSELEAARQDTFAEFREAWEAEAEREAKLYACSIRSRLDAEVKREILLAMERSAHVYAAESTTIVIPLPNEEMKGKLIGREGRNIRAFEQSAGVDLIIDDTPQAVVLSSFDPVRRDIARLALLNIMLDGRIHPARIEELCQKALEMHESTLPDIGRDAAAGVGIRDFPPAILRAIGLLRYRTSYAQNVLEHSIEVAEIAKLVATELGMDAGLAQRAALLHDIGKGLPTEWEGPHALAGMNFCRIHGESEPILNAIGAHHHDIDPTSDTAYLVIVADRLSASRPGARRESLELFVNRVAALESVAKSFRGVEHAYAIEAGREIRVLVRSADVDDLGAKRLAEQIARKIEQELEYPGEIKVTVIRETRASETAR